MLVGDGVVLDCKAAAVSEKLFRGLDWESAVKRSTGVTWGEVINCHSNLLLK